MMTGFEQFFANEFPRLLKSVGDEESLLSGDKRLSESSWDRKAAFLLWDALGRPTPKPVVDDFEDLLG